MERRVHGERWRRAALALGCCAWLGCQPAVVPTPTPLTVTLSSAQVAVAADTSQPAPEASVTLQLSAAPDPAFALRVNHTTSGLRSVTIDSSDRVRPALMLAFRTPGTLATGVTQDTVTVVACADPTCDHRGSAQTIAVSYTVTPETRPALAIVTSVSPQRVLRSAGPFSLVVNGSGFGAAAVALWDGQPRQTVLESSKRLTAAITQVDLGPGYHLVRVSREGPDAGSSNAGLVQVFASSDAPWLDSLSPASRPVGGPDFVLDVLGFGFHPGATVFWNGTPLTTTFVAVDQVSAIVPGTLLAFVGQVGVSVANTSPGPSSSSLTFTVVP